ncbi:hypothetical protein C1I95_25850 [Micromonospora craterilacus]|uniref:Uncharacterized protein n=2 Tax=Micromonospora craterilacus TaxID=1655439 RepID=A0A2W2E6X3_9ACTN|nr:hypothetical protein C1I95_25850 [Micromonospora craterilacus]
MPLLAACVAGPSEVAARPSVTYTCCETADVETLYEPGQTFILHWIVELLDDPTATAPPQVELNAHLTGPFATVDDLKAVAMGTKNLPGLVTFTAEPVRPAGTPDERPVSTIVIEPSAKPGYYNLVNSVADRESKVSGESIIQVVPSS